MSGIDELSIFCTHIIVLGLITNIGLHEKLPESEPVWGKQECCTDDPLCNASKKKTIKTTVNLRKRMNIQVLFHFSDQPFSLTDIFRFLGACISNFLTQNINTCHIIKKDPTSSGN